MGLAQESGRAGEALAAAYLELIGYEVVRRNVRFGHREIDLVARQGRTLVFVEVKLRTGGAAGEAALAVDRKKQREILTATGPMVGKLHRAGWRVRYDVVAIELDRGRRRLNLRHYPAPFGPPSSFVT